jgi:peptide/nickel transport system permease protein
LRTAQFSYLKALGVRLAAGIPVFIVVTFLATSLSSLVPGSAAQLILGDNASPEQIDALNARYGYDRPVLARYLDWLIKLMHGDLGKTLFSQQSVAELLFDRTMVTFEIAVLAMIVSLLIGVTLAMYSASRPGGIVDSFLHAASSIMLSIPTFVIVVLLGYIFAIVLRWLPATGWVSLTQDPLGNLHYVALPVMCLSVHQSAYFYRVSRSEFAAILQEDYVMVARAKGLPMRYILTRHALRPALPQILTVIGLSMTYLLGGSFIVESYFAVPGIGWTVLNSVGTHDFPVMQAILSLTVVIFVVIFALVDLGYAWIDPRVKIS